MLRPGNVHSADDWRAVLVPVIARYREPGPRPLLPRRRGVRQARAVRAAGGRGHRLRHPPAGQRGPAGADRPPADPARRPPAEEAAGVLRQLQLPGAELDQAAPGGGQGRVAPGRAVPAGRLHRHQPDPAGRSGSVKFYNGRGTAEQWIKEGKKALRWTRLSCRAFRDNAVRLQLFALAYNLANFLRSLALPRRGGAVVADDAAREAGQDRRPDRAPRPLRRVPAGRGGGAAGAVRRDPAPDRPLARTARGGGLTGADHGAAGAEGRTMRRDRPAAPEQPGSARGPGSSGSPAPGIRPQTMRSD